MEVKSPTVVHGLVRGYILDANLKKCTILGDDYCKLGGYPDRLDTCWYIRCRGVWCHGS